MFDCLVLNKNLHIFSRVFLLKGFTAIWVHVHCKDTNLICEWDSRHVLKYLRFAGLLYFFVVFVYANPYLEWYAIASYITSATHWVPEPLNIIFAIGMRRSKSKPLAHTKLQILNSFNAKRKWFIRIFFITTSLRAIDCPIECSFNFEDIALENSRTKGCRIGSDRAIVALASISYSMQNFHLARRKF